MAKRLVFLVLWIVAAAALVVVEAHDAVETVSAAAESAKDNANENAGKWSDWAANKFNEAWGSEDDDGSVQAMAGKVGEAASKSTESMNNLASESAEYASDKAGVAANMASEHMGDAKEYLSDKADSIANMASDAKDAVHDTFSQGWDKAGSMFNLGVEKLGDVYPTIGDTMAREAKARCESAKEKLSQATGDLGAAMRKESAEL